MSWGTAHSTMSLPFMKLGTLMVKTVSKPVAKALQASAKTNPTLRRGCIGLGNALHKLNFRINDLVDPEYRVKRVKPLEEAAALAKGSTFLGESFIFVVAAGVVVYEATDKAHKEKAKKAKAAEAEAAKRAEAARRWQDVEERVERLQQEHRALQARCEEQLLALAREQKHAAANQSSA